MSPQFAHYCSKSPNSVLCAQYMFVFWLGAKKYAKTVTKTHIIFVLHAFISSRKLLQLTRSLRSRESVLTFSVGSIGSI